jgi:hypothetical protein
MTNFNLCHWESKKPSSTAQVLSQPWGSHFSVVVGLCLPIDKTVVDIVVNGHPKFFLSLSQTSEFVVHVVPWELMPLSFFQL